MTNPVSTKLATALIKAQAEFQPIPKRGKNPFLKTEYATLDDLIGTIREPLHKHGLGFVQLLGSDETGAATLTTILFHESGESIECQAQIGTLENKQNALQALGGAITYMRRYSLAALLGLATGDDSDAEGAEKAVQKKAQAPAPKAPEPPKLESKSEPAPANGHTPNGNGQTPGAEPPARRPADLLAVVNGRLTVPYNDIHHLRGAIRNELGNDWNWPQFKDAASWLAAYAAAMKHGRAKESAAPSDLDAAFPREGA